MGHLFIVFGATPICRGLWYGARCFSPPYGPDHDRARRSTRAVRNLGEAPDPAGAACVRRGHNVPTASPCLALQACAGGVPGLEAPGIAARAGVRPGASVWLLRKPSESKRPLRAGAFAYRASFKTSVREPPQPPAMQHVAHGREIADHREVVRERMVHCAAASSRAAEIAVRANGSSLLSNSSRMNSTKIIRPAPAARAPLTQTGVEDHNLLHLVQLGQNIIRDHVHRFAPMHSEEDH